MQEEIEEFAAHYQKSILVRQILLGIPIVAVTGWASWSEWQKPITWTSNLLGVFFAPPALLFFLMSMIGAARMLFTNKPALSVTDAGVAYTPLYWKTKQVPWNKIGSFAQREQYAQRGNPLNVVDVLSNDSKPKALLSIYTDFLDHPRSEVTEVLEAFAAYQAHKIRASRNATVAARS